MTRESATAAAEGASPSSAESRRGSSVAAAEGKGVGSSPPPDGRGTCAARKIGADDPRVRLPRGRGRVLRQGPVIALVAGVGAVALAAVALALRAPQTDGRKDRAQADPTAPATANGWLDVLRHVTRRAKRELEMERDAFEGVARFDTSEYATYTEEEPNSLTADETRRFLEVMRQDFPRHYAMTYLGFATGLRPSSIRPLRRCGAQPDVLWDDGVVLVRRSHTLGDEVMETTKTGLRQRIPLPTEAMAVLRWHVETQIATEAERASELLFPSEEGGFGRALRPKNAYKVSKRVATACPLEPF